MFDIRQLSAVINLKIRKGGSFIKRLFLLLIATVLLFSFSGCKRSPEEEGTVDSVVVGAADGKAAQSSEQSAEQSIEQQQAEIKEEAKEPAASPEKTEASENKTEQKEENTAPQSERKNEENTTAEQEKIPVYQSNAEGSLVFDFDDMQLTQFVDENGAVVIYNAEKTYYFPPEYMHYSDLMEEIGEDGVIVAGYATGMRESFWKQSVRYTLTDFVITDVYRGAVAQKTSRSRKTMRSYWKETHVFLRDVIGMNSSI